MLQMTSIIQEIEQNRINMMQTLAKAAKLQERDMVGSKLEIIIIVNSNVWTNMIIILYYMTLLNVQSALLYNIYYYYSFIYIYIYLILIIYIYI